MNLNEAKEIADFLVLAMKPYCKWIEIAGSIRREKPEGIKDIEIVAIPKIEEIPDPEDLFGERTQAVNVLYKWAMNQGHISWIKPGASDIVSWHINPDGRYWRGIVEQESVKLDLFLPTPDRLWPTFLIRTGSAAFSEAMMIRARQTGYRFQDGHFCRIEGDQALGTSARDIAIPIVTLESEEAIFQCLRIEYVEPRDRTGPEAIKPLRKQGVIR